PEQVSSPATVGPPADVFSLGTLLYECLAGAPAFEAPTAVELFAKLEAGAYEPIRKVRPETPRWLAAVVGRALAHDPGARFASGTELERALAAGAPPLP